MSSGQFVRCGVCGRINLWERTCVCVQEQKRRMDKAQAEWQQSQNVTCVCGHAASVHVDMGKGFCDFQTPQYGWRCDCDAYQSHYVIYVKDES